MPEDPAKAFSLAEANELVPLVAEITAEVVERLTEIRRRYRAESDGSSGSVPGPALAEVHRLLQEWSDSIVKLGARAKGYFTVDFQSMDPELLYCWSYGEDKIGFTHKVWENFSHRRPLTAGFDEAADRPKWVN